MKQISILGAGESGTGAALLAKKKKWKVFLSDRGKINPTRKKELKKLKIDWEEGQHSYEKIVQSDLIVKSPGIPETAPLIKKLRQAGKTIVSEIEFAFQYSDARIIAITGSNGKTTTTSLIYQIFKDAGFNVGLAGNIGQSYARQVAESKKDLYILELSSFQLDDIKRFRPDIAILTNITPDHLDRYDYSFEKYAFSKLRIIENQSPQDQFIYCSEDEGTNKHFKVGKLSPQCHSFGLKKQKDFGPDAFVDNGEIHFTNIKNNFTIKIDDVKLKGPHNQLNVMAAVQAALYMNVPLDSLRKTLKRFSSLEHRMEEVKTIKGVHFINDSKATNVVSVKYALETISDKIVWMVGGVDKGNDYSEIFQLVKEKVLAIAALGKDNVKIIESFRKLKIPIKEFQDIDLAVKWSNKQASKGCTILLSPACASFDLFKNYEDRGLQFKGAIEKL